MSIEQPNQSFGAPEASASTEELNLWGKEVQNRWREQINQAGLTGTMRELFMSVIQGMPEAEPGEAEGGTRREDLMERYRARLYEYLQPRLRDARDQLERERQSGFTANITPEERIGAQLFELFTDDTYKTT